MPVRFSMDGWRRTAGIQNAMPAVFFMISWEFDEKSAVKISQFSKLLNDFEKGL